MVEGIGGGSVTSPVIGGGQTLRRDVAPPEARSSAVATSVTDAALKIVTDQGDTLTLSLQSQAELAPASYRDGRRSAESVTTVAAQAGPSAGVPGSNRAPEPLPVALAPPEDAAASSARAVASNISAGILPPAVFPPPAIQSEVTRALQELRVSGVPSSRLKEMFPMALGMTLEKFVRGPNAGLQRFLDQLKAEIARGPQSVAAGEPDAGDGVNTLPPRS